MTLFYENVIIILHLYKCKQIIIIIKGEKKTVKNKLKELRLAKNLTQKQVCKELENFCLFIDRTTYSKYETGERNITCETLCLLADYFGTSIDYILGRQ